MNYPITTLDQLRPILLGFRKSRGLTQSALAELLGVTQQTYAQLEANPASASVERLFKVLRVLGVEWVLADARVAMSSVADADPQAASAYPVPLHSAEAHQHQAAEPSRSAPKNSRSATKKREAW